MSPNLPAVLDLAIVESMRTRRNREPIATADAEKLFRRRRSPGAQSPLPVACHGEARAQGRARYADPSGACSSGGESRPALSPGKPELSWLYAHRYDDEREIKIAPKERHKERSTELNYAAQRWITCR